MFFLFFLPVCVFNVFCIETAYAMEVDSEVESEAASNALTDEPLEFKGLYLPLKTPNFPEHPLKLLKRFEDEFTFSIPPLDSRLRRNSFDTTRMFTS